MIVIVCCYNALNMLLFLAVSLVLCVCVCGFWRVPEAMPLKLVFASSWPLVALITKTTLL